MAWPSSSSGSRSSVTAAVMARSSMPSSGIWWRMRQHPAGICGAAGIGGGEGGAVEGSGGSVDQRELAAGLHAGGVDEQVGALGRREHEPVRRHAGGGAEQPVVGADLGDLVEFGFTVAEQH